MKHCWITMQYLDGLDERGIWVKDKPGYRNSADEVKKNDLIAIYVGRKYHGPSAIFRLAQVTEIHENPDREGPNSKGDYWNRVADIKFIAKKGNCHLEDLFKILTHDSNLVDRMEMGRYLNSRCGGKVDRISTSEFEYIGKYFSDYKSKYSEAENRTQDYIETVIEPKVPGLLPLIVKSAIEKYAVRKAKQRLSSFHPKDAPRRFPYDLAFKKHGKDFFVEVKGTQRKGDIVPIYLTPKEKNHAQDNRETSLLFVLYSIKIRNANGKAVASGGKEVLLNPWEIDESNIQVSLFQYPVQTSNRRDIRSQVHAHD